MEKTVREISKETFDKNDILNLKMESNKMEEIYLSSFLNVFLIVVIIFGILSLSCLVWGIIAIKDNKEWIAEYGDEYDYLLWDHIPLYFIGSIGFGAVAGWSIYSYITETREARAEFVEVNSKISEVTDYDSYVEFKEWLVNDKLDLLTNVSKAVRESKKSNDLAKGLIIGSMLF